MKPPKKNNKLRKTIAVMIALLTLIAVVIGLYLAYDKAKEIYLAQCVITDPHRQVSITAGKMVKASVVAESLGLIKGANLAQINFTEKRNELLRRAPNLRNVYISRRLPDRVIVKTEERIPIAKMGVIGLRKTTGRVIDEEGVVFLYQRDTQQLPVIRERNSLITTIGGRAKDRSADAVTFLRVINRPEFTDLAILEIDTSKHDFLVVTLSDYSKLKICWEDEADLEQRLKNLLSAIHSKVASGIKIWNATIPNRIFADTQEKL